MWVLSCTLLLANLYALWQLLDAARENCLMRSPLFAPTRIIKVDTRKVNLVDEVHTRSAVFEILMLKVLERAEVEMRHGPAGCPARPTYLHAPNV
jgi:hypothetical protein